MELTQEIICDTNAKLEASKEVSVIVRKTLQKHAKPDCCGCDGYGIFYGNVAVCPCVEVK